ncbi:uncharacterized protein METZ01_LOCUS262131, partial [marine metagenome]
RAAPPRRRRVRPTQGRRRRPVAGRHAAVPVPPLPRRTHTGGLAPSL